MGKVPWTYAALGENVPANPPDSFQATICPGDWPLLASATWIPMSWLKPALAVHRSMLPLSRAIESVAGVIVMASGVLEVVSRSVQVAPSLLPRRYCALLAIDWTVPDDTGISWAVRRGGEEEAQSGHGPAPARMVAPGADRFVFHCIVAGSVLPAGKLT